MAQKQNKTNVMRILDRAKVAYLPHYYDHSDGVIDGAGVAHKLGQDPAQVFKTLVTQGGKEYYVFVLPVEHELDLKAAARAVGAKSVSMVHVKDINRITGYIRGGCSPVGMRKQYPTVFDSSARLFDTIMVSAGKIGAQVQADPVALAGLCGATFADILVR